MATIIDDENLNFAWIGTSWSTIHDAIHRPKMGTTVLSHGKVRIYQFMALDGLYGVAVDNGDTQYFSGYSLNGEFQATLFATNGLEQGTHHLKITNENARNTEEYPDYIWLDIDSVAVTGNLISGSSVSVDDSSASASASASASSSSAVSSSLAVTATTETSSTSTSASSSSSSSIESSITRSEDVVSGQYSTSGTVNIISTATDDLNSAESSSSQTPTRPSSSSTADSSAADDGGNKDNHKTTTLAVSISVIVVSGLVVLSIAGWWYWRRRKRRQQDDFDEDMRGYLEPQSSWR
ncbi:hypothetical protein IAT40_001029 [Kwoniella sp. CBS 6097]